MMKLKVIPYKIDRSFRNKIETYVSLTSSSGSTWKVELTIRYSSKMGGKNLWAPISLRKCTYSSLSTLFPQGLMFQYLIMKTRARKKDHFTSKDVEKLMFLVEAEQISL